MCFLADVCLLLWYFKLVLYRGTWKQWWNVAMFIYSSTLPKNNFEVLDSQDYPPWQTCWSLKTVGEWDILNCDLWSVETAVESKALLWQTERHLCSPLDWQHVWLLCGNSSRVRPLNSCPFSDCIFVCHWNSAEWDFFALLFVFTDSHRLNKRWTEPSWRHPLVCGLPFRTPASFIHSILTAYI